MIRRLPPMLAACACALILCAREAGAFRMIQNTSTGRTTVGARVLCDDPGGFVHWTTSSITWQLSLANQGGKVGVAAALQRAIASWNNVTPASYTLTYAGTTSAGFFADGLNTVSWGIDGGCSGSCLAITALVLAPGQVITEVDISFNDAAVWNTNGSDYDVEAIAAHELGHSLGIHHTELTKPRNRPTMYASYFGTAGRSLETDDWSALNCSFNRYPPAAAIALAPPVPDLPAYVPPRSGVTLSSRIGRGGAILRYALDVDQTVALELYDIAGRKLAALVDGYQGAGAHEIAWDGSTAMGRMPHGVYFARIVTDAGTAHATVVLVE